MDAPRFQHRFADPQLARMAAAATLLGATNVMAPVAASGPAVPAAAGGGNPANATFLRYSHEYYDVVQTGTAPAGAAGGSTSPVTWARDVPVSPTYCTEAILTVTVPINITVPATSTANISQFLPYCLFQHSLTLGGAPPFATTSGVPFWLDEITSRRGWDPSDNTVAPADPANQQDPGPTSYNLGGLTPGGTIVNATGAPVVTAATITVTYRIRFQRRARSMFGCVPLGDPVNRPVLALSLSPLVGNHPEDNLIQDIGNKGITAVTSAPATLTLTWKAKKLDLLPAGMDNPGAPTIGMGLALNSNGGQSIVNSGQIQQVQHRASMVYEKIFHVLINNQAGVRPDYFGMWNTGEVQSARWEFDGNQGTTQNYYDELLRKYGRYLPTGVMVADLESGIFPEDPKLDPELSLMSPDVGYAASVGVVPTPAMYTAVRVPAATGIVGAYVRTFSFGLVGVTY